MGTLEPPVSDPAVEAADNGGSQTQTMHTTQRADADAADNPGHC